MTTLRPSCRSTRSHDLARPLLTAPGSLAARPAVGAAIGLLAVWIESQRAYSGLPSLFDRDRPRPGDAMGGRVRRGRSRAPCPGHPRDAQSSRLDHHAVHGDGDPAAPRRRAAPARRPGGAPPAVVLGQEAPRGHADHHHPAPAHPYVGAAAGGRLPLLDRRRVPVHRADALGPPGQEAVLPTETSGSTPTWPWPATSSPGCPASRTRTTRHATSSSRSACATPWCGRPIATTRAWPGASAGGSPTAGASRRHSTPGDARPYWASAPPSTTISLPVTYEASSEARKTTAFTTSSTVPIRPSGTR